MPASRGKHGTVAPMQLVYDFEPVLAFVQHRMPGLARADGMRAIGQETDGQIVAGVIYEGINPFHCWMHMAALPGAVVVRSFIAAAFAYPFKVLGCQRVSGYVDASNTVARRIDERLGFTLDAVLKGAAQDGGDVLIFAMRPEQCRFLGD